jgi:long-chain acyl-CoA synthetase
MDLADTHNAAQIFFDQAQRDDLQAKPRFMVAVEGSRGETRWLPVSWSEAAGRVQWLASYLMNRGVDRDVKVAVMGNTRLEWGLTGLAVLAARGTLVPVYPSLRGDSLAHIIRHSDTEVVVVETAEQFQQLLLVWRDACSRVHTLVTIEPLDVARLAEAVGVDPAHLESISVTLERAEDLGREQLRTSPRRVLDCAARIPLDDIGYLIYTSGTTGMPKGVPLTHRNVGVNGAAWIEVNQGLLHGQDIDLLWLPMSHIFGWGEFCLGNQLGFITYFSQPAKVLDHLLQVRPHVLMSVPAYWDKLAQMAIKEASGHSTRIAELRRLTGGRLRFCLSGGAGLRPEVKELFLKTDMLIIEGYGLTECSPTLTMNRPNDFDFETVGKPFPGVKLKVAEDGEILAKGDSVFAGYYKDPQATRLVFDADGWLHTGDLGRFTDRGFLKIIGRKKEILVTSGGKNIPPENIELRFKGEPLIAHLVVFGDGKKFLTALVDIDEEVARSRLIRHGDLSSVAPRHHPHVCQWVQLSIDKVNAQLAGYETIKRFCVAEEPFTVEAGLLTPSLKVKRKQVYERFAGQLESLYA